MVMCNIDNIIMEFRYSIFFFQAEDGIRDYKVTGVQTCALPIWPRGIRPRAPVLAGRRVRLHPEADRSRSLRGVVAPRHSGARAEPPREGSAVGPGALRE